MVLSTECKGLSIVYSTDRCLCIKAVTFVNLLLKIIKEKVMDVVKVKLSPCPRQIHKKKNRSRRRPIGFVGSDETENELPQFD